MSTGEVVRGYALLNDMRRRFMNRGGVGEGLSGSGGGGTTSDADRSQRVCRNLFGPVDVTENRRFLDRQLGLIRNEQNERWNFDFDRETPLPGRFQWETVTKKSDSETVTDNETASNEDDLHLQSRIITRSVSKLNVSSSSESETSSTIIATTAVEQATNSALHSRTIKRRRQTTISEFMPQRKRFTSDEKRPLVGVKEIVDSDDVMQSSTVSQTP